MGMSAAQIKLGEEYAIEWNDPADGLRRMVRFRTSAQTTVRTARETTNTFRGRVFRKDGTEVEQNAVPVGAFLGPFEQYTQLMEEKKALDAEKERIADARRERRRYAADLLTEMMGFPTIDWSNDKYDYKNTLFATVEYSSELHLHTKDDETLERFIANLEAIKKGS